MKGATKGMLQNTVVGLSMYKLNWCPGQALHKRSIPVLLSIFRIARNIGGLWMQFDPKPNIKKILAEFKFGSGISGLFIKEHCRLSLEVPEQSHEFKK